MQKIEIPDWALARHEATLGNAVLAFLKRVAGQKPIRWNVRNPKNQEEKDCKKKCDGVLSTILSGNCVPYWKWLCEQFEKYHILIAKPAVLFVFAKRNERKLNELSSSERKAVDEVVAKIFNYLEFRDGKILLMPDAEGRIQWFSKSKKSEGHRRTATKNKEKEYAAWDGWGIARFIDAIDVRYCPYCNAETVGTARLPDRDFVSDVDHVLPKDVYPLLSLSLYNLVPSCNRCNSRFKRTKDLLKDWSLGQAFDHIHPYVYDAHKHFNFVYRPTSIEDLFVRKAIKRTPVRIDVKDSMGREFVDDYHLAEIYRDLYGVEINSVIRTELIYSGQFVKTMVDVYGITESEKEALVNRTAHEVMDINCVRFAKLTGDLLIEVGETAGHVSKAFGRR